MANIIAWPISYFIMNNWLQDYAYKVDIELRVFLLSGLIAVIIGMVTVSYQTIKKATINPVESIRHE